MNFHGGDIYGYGRELLDFSSNINPLGVPESFRRLMSERLEDFTRYPDITYREVREIIASYIGLDSIEDIIPGNGAVELIYKLAASSGMKRAYGLRPTFSEYGRAARVAGLEYLDIPAFASDYTSVDTEALFAGIEPESLVIICNPNNPTGTFIDRETMKKFAGALMGKGCRLVIDEAFIEFTDGYPGNSMVSETGELMNLTVIRAATKFFGMPGIRLGYAVTRDKAAAEKLRGLMEPWNLNTAAVIAAYSIFEDWNYIEKSRAWIKTEREYLYRELCGIEELITYSSEANFHLLRLKNEASTAASLKQKMSEEGILIRTAEGFNGLSEFYFRLAVKDRLSNDKLLKAIRGVLR